MSSPTQSIRQDEAIRRRELLDVQEYDVRLDLTTGEETFDSVTTIRFSSAGGPTFVDLKPAAVRGVHLNGRAVDVDLLQRGRLPLDTAAGANELVVNAVMPYRNDGEGLHRSVDALDGRAYVYGMSFMDAAPTIFACFDQPDLKAPYVVHVTAPADWLVVGNGAATQVEPGRWELARTEPLATYFVTLVAGPYHLIEDHHDGIPLGISSRRSLAASLDADAEEILTLTRQSFDELHRLFGIRYPFGSYHQAFVPEFNAGAMENPGCVTLRDEFVFDTRVTRGKRISRATMIAHEMAHQWFGNIVTPRWWDDLWLNESVAEYLGNRVAAEATEYADTWADTLYARRQWGLGADQGPGTHPVAGNGAEDAITALQSFDGISYAKGSAILRQLNATLGDELFFDGIVDHLERHRFDNATMHDLLGSWARVGATGLDDLTDQWLTTAGADTISLDRAAGLVRRTPPTGSDADRRHTFDVAVAGTDGWSREQVTLAGPTAAYDAGEAPVLLDPDGDTWAVIHPDALTMAALPSLLPRVEDPLMRAGVWSAVRSGVTDAVVDPAIAVDLAVAAFPVEDTEDSPHRSSARRTQPWIFQFLLPVAPAGSLERVHAATVGLVTSLEPGSEHQLAAFRAAVKSATDADLVRGWLDALPAGLEADADLRWRLLVRLAALGASDADALDAELASAPTALARVEHARARASLPAADAKEFAWARLTGEVAASNYEIEAAGLGLWQADQAELTAPYVDRYLDALPTLSSVHSGWVLGETVEAFFPITVLDAGLADRAADLAGRDDLDPTVRRRLLDVTDRLRQMVAIRAAYPS